MTKHPRIWLWSIMLVPWLSLPFLGKKSIRRFFAASLFITLSIRLESYIAENRKWWWFYERLFPKARGETPLLWGQYLIGSMWILKYTYGHFLKYLVVNFFTDLFFIFPFSSFLKKLGVFSYVRLSRPQVMIIFLVKSLLLYGFQFIKENVTSADGIRLKGKN